MTKIKLSPLFKEIIFILSAVITGISLQMTWFTSHGWNPMQQNFVAYALGEAWDRTQMNLRLWGSAIGLVIVFYLLRSGLRFCIKKLKSSAIFESYRQNDTVTYFVFLLSGLAGCRFLARDCNTFSCFFDFSNRANFLLK